MTTLSTCLLLLLKGVWLKMSVFYEQFYNRADIDWSFIDQVNDFFSISHRNYIKHHAFKNNANGNVIR